MLPEAGATELIFLAAVALIVVGPKDLPVLMRKVGQWIAKMRGLAAEFRSSFDELARQSELDELRKEVEALRNGQASTATTINSAFNEITPHIEPEGYATVETPFESAVGAPVDPHREYPAVGPGFGAEDAAEPAAKPKRAPRKKGAAAEPDPESEAAPASKPRRAAAPKSAAVKTAKAPAKPRAKRAAPAESEA
jgi:sec-independent protein translocase protein TatB